ncbi:MAG: NUDIX domain-containing protein [Opitutales bacterium]
MWKVIGALLVFSLSVNYGFTNDVKEKTISEKSPQVVSANENQEAVPVSIETKDLKTEVKNISLEKIEDNKTYEDSKGSFRERVFKKTPSLASSVIIKVYNQGKFMGIVLIERGRPPLGKALPGGIIRYEETCEDCVARTARDECGLNIQNMKQFHVYSSSDRDPRTHMIDIVFTAQCTEFIPSAGTDAKHAFVCPINEIPWDRLAFDHAQILKDFLEFELSKDNKDLKQDLSFPTIVDKKEREEKDLKEISKNAYRPPLLATTVIIEVYEKDMFKGIVMIERGLEPYGKALPGGPVQYGETVQYTAKREMKEECNLDLTDVKQFRVYDSLNRDPRRRCIDAVHISRCDNVIPQAGSDAAKLWVCPLDKIPWDELAFDHAEILRDYLVWREGAFYQQLHNP